MPASKYHVRLLSIAEEDFTEIISFIAADNIVAAKSLASKIEKNLKLLSQNSLNGRTPREIEIKNLGYRYIVVENYLNFYTIEEKTVYIHRILHGERNHKEILLK